MVVALKPLHDAAGIKRVVVSTYQSVSGAGKDGMDELLNQTKSLFVNQTLDAKKFTKRIAFNVIPHIDVFMDDGSTKEEWKMVVETKKILDPKINVHATCVRVPVFIGHAEAVNLEFERPLAEHEARRVLAASPACWWSTAARTAATSRRRKPPARTTSLSAACATIRRSTTAFRSGSSATTCARARRSTRCRSPRS